MQSIVRKNFRTRKYKNNNRTVVDDLAQSIINSSKKNGYVMGHICYGAHSLFSYPCVYATMLRRPPDRIVSLYLHAVREKKSFYHKAATGLSFEDFLKQKSVLELDNGMVRFLSGDPKGGYFINQKPFGELSHVDLDAAIRNLKYNIASFGLLESFDLSLLLFEREINIKKKYYIKENESPASNTKPIFPNEHENLIKYDKELYEIAVSEFKKRVSAAQINDYDLESFRAKNRLVTPYYKLIKLTKNIIKNCLRTRIF